MSRVISFLPRFTRHARTTGIQAQSLQALPVGLAPVADAEHTHNARPIVESYGETIRFSGDAHGHHEETPRSSPPRMGTRTSCPYVRSVAVRSVSGAT